MHCTLNFCPEARKELNVPKLKSSEGLAVVIYINTVIKKFLDNQSAKDTVFWAIILTKKILRTDFI